LKLRENKFRSHFAKPKSRKQLKEATALFTMCLITNLTVTSPLD